MSHEGVQLETIILIFTTLRCSWFGLTLPPDSVSYTLGYFGKQNAQHDEGFFEMG